MKVTESSKSQNDVPRETSIPECGASLESILCTEELQRRPSRPPDYEKENSSLVKLVSALADSPNTVLQTLAETILHITQCDSAGVSLLTKDGKTPDVCGERFYWPAIAGMWKPHIRGGTPRDFGPCGDVLDRNCTLLFKHFERRYTYFLPITPLIEECLLVPFYVGGKAVGTIWAIMHDDRRKFDREHERLMLTLGQFASSAYQTLTSIEDLKLQMAAREKAEAAVRELANGLETQVRVRTQDLERSTRDLLETNEALEREIAERKAAKEALQLRELNLRLLADSIPAPVAVMTPSGKVEAVNKPNLEYFGKTLEDLKKWGTSDAVHPDDLPHSIEIWMEAIQTGQPYDVKQRLRRFDGVYRWFEARGFPLRGPDGRILNWCVLLTDIDDRQRAEEALRASEAYSAEAQRLSHTGSWHWNVSTGEMAWSQEYCAIFGFDFEKDKPSYQLFIERVHPEDRPKVERVLWADAREKRDFDGEYRLLLPDGSIKYLHSLAKCSLDQSGDVEYIGAVVDITEHKRAEQELRDSEERHRVVVEAASDAVISMDENGAILLANAAALRVFGYDPTELIGKPLTLLMPEYMRKLHENGFKRYLATSERHINWQATEFTGLRKNGQEFPVEVSFGENVTETGHRFTGFIRDVSARKRVEENLRRSEQRWRAVFENSAIGVALTDMTGRFLTTNSAYQQMLGYSDEELTKLTFLELTLDDDHKRNRALVAELIDGKRSQFQIEKRYRRKDGRLIWVSNNVSLVPGAEDSPRFVMALSEDITERKRAEDTFRLIVAGTAATTGSDFFRSLVQHMAQALRARYAFVTTCDDQKHARTLAFWKGDGFGENFEFDIADTPCKKVLHGEVCHYRQGLQGLFPRDTLAADWQAESYLGVPMLDEINRVMGHIAILDDKPMEAEPGSVDLLKIFAGRAAAELKRQKAEDELRAALQEGERMREELAHLAHQNRVSTMGELAASLAHEIKQPISAAMTDARTCSRWLTRDHPDLAEAQTAASRVVKDVARASEIIGRVRSLFKKDSLQQEEVEINELIQEMIALLRGEASRHSISIHSDFSLDLRPIMADRVQLQQVLMNLMLNSIEAMKSMNTPGKLTIKSQQDDSGQLLISVMDTGVGVPPEKTEEIFNPFFTSKPEGTGMGLAISRSIIVSHGGRLWAVSNPESGATFHFTLPARSNAHQAA
jgi:PAS domain S-box-containing protein